MSPPSKLRKKCMKMALKREARHSRLYRRRMRWEHEREVMKALSTNLKNETGKSRTSQENKLFIYAIEAALDRRLESIKNKTLCQTDVSWRQIEEEVARDFRARQHITDLRKEYFLSGDVVVFGEYVGGDDNM
jgi:hypothetical protein